VKDPGIIEAFPGPDNSVIDLRTPDLQMVKVK
jgi:hypothetical protein